MTHIYAQYLVRLPARKHRMYYGIFALPFLTVIASTMTVAIAVAQELANVDLVLQLGHGSRVNSAVFSPDGRTVMSTTADHSKLWDVATGRELRTLTGHESQLTAATFANGGRSVVSVSESYDLKRYQFKTWDVETGRELSNSLLSSVSVRSIAAGSDGRTILTAEGATIKLRELTNGRELRAFAGLRQSVNRVQLSPDGRIVVAVDDMPSIKLWDLETGRELATLNKSTGSFSPFAIAPNALTMLVGDNERIKLYDVESGRELRTFLGETKHISTAAFSPDSLTVLTGDADNTLKLWDVTTGRQLRTFTGHSGAVLSIAFSPDGHTALSGSDDNTVKLWDIASGRELRTFTGSVILPGAVASSRDGRTALSARHDGKLEIWDVASWRQLQTYTVGSLSSFALSPDGSTALTGSEDKTIKLWDVASGRELRTFGGHSEAVVKLAFSPDSLTALSASEDKTMKLWDVASGRALATLSGHADGLTSVAFSPDGRSVASSSLDDMLKIWDLATGRELRSSKVGAQIDMAFSPDGRSLLAAKLLGGAKLWDVATGREIQAFVGHSSSVNCVAFSPDGSTALTGSEDKTIKLWDVASGRELRTFTGHDAGVMWIAFSRDGRNVWSASYDGTFRIWAASNGHELARRARSKEGSWLIMTPAGFFDRVGVGEVPLHLVRGMTVTTIDQVHQVLYAPDLVRESLAGDPEGLALKAASVMNMSRVVGSGPPPSVVIATPASSAQTVADVLSITAHVFDRGKGVGRIEWRVNGITAAVTSEPPGGGPEYTLTQQLALDPGDNTIEVVAYNAQNLLASLPARTTVKHTEPAEGARPRLHVLAIGIDAYVDRGWTPPGATHPLAFGKLELAVKDATALAAALGTAGADLYSDVRITTALDTQATAANLDLIVDKIAKEIHPRDTFVLFAAAHGASHNGHFYLIPQDYQGGPDPAALASHAIGQDRLQDWLANRIKAKRSVILLDTCESGALVGGATRSRLDVPASDAAVGRLHEATGRPVLTAAAEGKPAFEGFEGHGVFTWALLDALRNSDRNANGRIELSELVAHVQDQVPRIAARLNGRGVAAIAVRGATDDAQSARFGSRGEDFALVAKLH